jgi:hypothetical protein
VNVICPKCGREGQVLPGFTRWPWYAIWHYEHIGRAWLCIVHFRQEILAMAELSKTVTTTVKKYVAQVQAIAGGPVETQETDAAGTKIRTLRTYTQDVNGNLVET